jgi:hypothetical protein
MTLDLDKDSLFSLELVVDRLVLAKNVTCRFPAVAFRLLDFPTLLVHQIHPELADTLRVRLQSDPHNVVPIQLRELQDRNGLGFVIRRGKSCLLRLSPNAMRTHLATAPLYVMVVDAYPETPKLVASCVLPLDVYMNQLYDEICTRGVSIPAVSGENCEVPVSNLMGDKLGTLFVSVRLHSLGSALLAHVPVQAAASVAAPADDRGEKRENFSPVIERTSEEKQFAMVVGSKPPADDDAVEIPSPALEQHQQIVQKSFADGHTQVESGTCETVATQTSKRKAVQNKNRTRFASEDAVEGYVDDINPTNVVCPPPLFYHSRPSTARNFSWHCRQDWSMTWQVDSDDWSDDGTIRPEDRCEDFDDDDENSAEISSVPRSTVVRRDASASNRNRASPSSSSKVDPTAKAAAAAAELSQFPIINALLAEILRLKGMNLVPAPSASDADATRYAVQRLKTKPVSASKRPSFAAPATRERTCHRCFDVSGPIPKDVSWLGQRSSAAAPPPTSSSSLVAGMTKTQRLRLSQVNPRRLEELEMREAQRRSEVMAAMSQRGKSRPKSAAAGSASADVRKRKQTSSDGRGRTWIDEYETERVEAVVDRLGESLESRESTIQPKRPVPTPRTSKLSQKNKENQRQFADVHQPSFVGTKTFIVPPRKTEPPLSLRSSSEEKIQLTLPTFDEEPDAKPVKQSAAKRKTDFHADRPSSGRDRPSALGSTRILSAPTVPKVPTVEPLNDDPGDVNLSVEDLGLKKYVERYLGDSDDSDDGDKESDQGEEEERDEDDDDRLPDAETTGEEPALKKVVERYSDDSDDGLGGLKRTVERYSDDDDAGLEEQEKLAYRIAFGIIAQFCWRHELRRNSAASPESGGRAASKGNGVRGGRVAVKTAERSSSHRRPVELPEALSPRKGAKNG